MTEKPKCPFCGYKLNESYDSDENIVGYFCANPHCRIKADVLEPYVWRALIDGKKAQDALKVATDCIENIGDTWRDGSTWTNDDMGEIRDNIEGYCDSILKKIKEIKK